MPWDQIVARQFPAFDKELDGISRQTMEDHYKLYEGYVKKTNECREILKQFDYAEVEGNQVYSQLRTVSIEYTFAMLGFKNHDLYFGHLGGEGGDPSGRFAELGGDQRQAAHPRAPDAHEVEQPSGPGRLVHARPR